MPGRASVRGERSRRAGVEGVGKERRGEKKREGEEQQCRSGLREFRMVFSEEGRSSHADQREQLKEMNLAELLVPLRNGWGRGEQEGNEPEVFYFIF